MTPVDEHRKSLAQDLLADLRRLDRALRTNAAQIQAAVSASKTTLTTLHGIGPVLAAKILGHTSEISRFPTRHHYASYCGTAPIEASSGEQHQHRLSRAGNRQLNRALHLMALCQICTCSQGKDYYQQKLAEMKTPAEARRALKRVSGAMHTVARCPPQRHADVSHGGPQNSVPRGSVPRRVVVRDHRWRLYNNRSASLVKRQARQQSQHAHPGEDPAHQLQVYAGHADIDSQRQDQSHGNKKNTPAKAHESSRVPASGVSVSDPQQQIVIPYIGPRFCRVTDQAVVVVD